MESDPRQNDTNFLEAVQNAQIKELFAKVRQLESMIDDIANQVFLNKEKA